MEGVGADAEVETLLTGVLDEVLVGANTGGLEGLGAQLLILVGDEVDAEREVVDNGTLAAKIEDANLGVGDTTVEARLGVRLYRKTSSQRTVLLCSYFLLARRRKFSLLSTRAAISVHPLLGSSDSRHPKLFRPASLILPS